MNCTVESQVIRLPIDRAVEVGRFVFASKGGAYRFMLEPRQQLGFAARWEMVAEWCEHGESEPCDGGYDFWGGSRTFSTPEEALGAMYEYIARAALEEKHSLDSALAQQAEE
jgi:hypothetical protein